MSESQLLPTFFVIGASKAGTTSLHEYLRIHPEIAMTEPKEPHLLAGPGWRERLWGYEKLFPRQAPIRGEASTGYSVYPTNPGTAERIADIVPRARLIYLVRDPVDRVIAHYAQAATTGRERRSLGGAIVPEDPGNYYVSASRYATQAEVYLRHFDEERLLVLERDELRASRRAALRRVFSHLGADPDFWDDSLVAEYNVRGVDNVRWWEPLGRLRWGRANRLSRRVLPAAARRRLVSLIRRVGGTEVRPEVSDELRERLAEALAPEAERLRRLTGQEFAGWSV